MTDGYMPTTEEIRDSYAADIAHLGTYSEKAKAFDRWYIQEIEKAEYSGYLRAVREGLHR